MILRWLLIALLLCGGAQARMTLTGAGAASVSVLTITAVNLSGNTFTGGAASGTVVGTISVTVTGGSFTGSLSLTGTDAASFQIVGTNLETNGVVATGTYSINIVATQAGAVGSPFTQPETITGGGGSTITFTSLTNSQDGTQAALVGTYTSSAPSGLGSQSWGGGTGCSGTPTITSFVASGGTITANVAALATGNIGCTFTATGTGANTGTGTATAVVWPSGVALIAVVSVPHGNSGGTSAAIRATGGTLLTLGVSAYSGASFYTPSDSLSNTWAPLTAHSSGGQNYTRLWYVLGGPTVGTAQTFTYAGTTADGGAEVQVYSGTTPAIDQESGSAPAFTTACSPPSITPALANSLFVSISSYNSASGNIQIDSGFNITTSQPFGTAEGGAMAYKIQSGGPSGISPSWTKDNASSADWSCSMAVFKP